MSDKKNKDKDELIADVKEETERVISAEEEVERAKKAKEEEAKAARKQTLKRFVDDYNAGATKSKLIVGLNKAGLTNQEIVDIFKNFGLKMSYNHVYNVLSKVEGIIMHTSSSRTAAGEHLEGLNKSEFIKKLGHEGKTRDEIVKAFADHNVPINKTMIYGILRKEGLISSVREERVQLKVVE